MLRCCVIQLILHIFIFFDRFSLFCLYCVLLFFFFFFNDTATTEIYTLSLHDALPICRFPAARIHEIGLPIDMGRFSPADRKSTRLNSSHRTISYAVFCLKKKKIRPPSAQGSWIFRTSRARRTRQRAS